MLQRQHLVFTLEKGEHYPAGLVGLFSVAPSTAYRTVQRESAKHTS
ncbi:hypothetical protein ACT4S5_01470 [Kocuria oceani]